MLGDFNFAEPNAVIAFAGPRVVKETTGKDLPEGFQLPEGRVKPWGTGHAVLAARNAIETPFAVINADDFFSIQMALISP